MDGEKPIIHSRLAALWGIFGDLGRIGISECVELLVQISIPSLILCLFAATGAREAVERRFLRFDPAQMIGTPLQTAPEGERESGAPPGAKAEPIVRPDSAPRESKISPWNLRVWRNRWAYLMPSLYETSLLLLAGLVAASAVALLLALPALRAERPAVRGFFGLLNECGLLLCSLPVFVAGFVIRLKVPHENRMLYYCVAALTLGVGNLTLAEMVQMLRTRLQEEMSQPYFDLVEVRGIPLWRALAHRAKPYARALLLSLKAKVPILFSSVVIIEIILSLPLGGRSPIEKGLGLVAREAAEAGDGITLLALIIVVSLWIRAFSFFANAATYLFLWNPRSAE